MKLLGIFLIAGLLLCGSEGRRLPRQFDGDQYGNQYFAQNFPQEQGFGFNFPGQTNQGQWGNPWGNQGNQGNGQWGGQQGGQNGGQWGGQGGQQGGGQWGGGQQGNQGNGQWGGQNGQQGGQQGGNQWGGQGGQGQIQRTTQPPPPATTAIVTTLAPAVQNCVDSCLNRTTNEYNPVCGSDNITYHNPSRLECAQECGVNTARMSAGGCPRPTTPPTPV